MAFTAFHLYFDALHFTLYFYLRLTSKTVGFLIYLHTHTHTDSQANKHTHAHGM